MTIGDRIKQCREAKKTTPQKTPFRAGYMLSSMIYCKRCGARYSANHGYYKCYSRSKSSKKFIADPNCMNDNWIIQDLDNAVTNEILKLKMSEEYKKNIVKSDNLDKPKIKSEIKKIDIQIEKILDLYQISDIPISSIKQKIEKLNRQKNELQKMADSEIDVSTAIENFEMYLNRFVKIYNTAGVPEKRVVISNLIDKIEVDGRKIFISWRL